MAAPDKGAGRSGSTRRQFLLGGAVAGVGAAAAIGADLALSQNDSPTASASVPLNGDTVVSFYGAHQAGVDTDAQAHGTFVGLSLHDDVDRDGLRRLMQVLTDDASRLTQGEAALADSEPEMASTPARLTVTFGFGVGIAIGAHPDFFDLHQFCFQFIQLAFDIGNHVFHSFHNRTPCFDQDSMMNPFSE